MGIIEIQNHGPLITSTNYWASELAKEGKLYVSVHADAIRVLLPPRLYEVLKDMCMGKECVLSRGPCPAQNMPDVVEIMFDDGSHSPLTLHLTPESFDMLPGKPVPGREWVVTVWTEKDRRPTKSLERICHWRRVARLPCLASWKP
jgi:hypothetical protein